jgi:ATP-binding cassette subfamily B (MDR/TAP) protein 1
MLGTDLGGNRLSTDITSSGGVAMESLLNIKTIASLNLERTRYSQFEAAMEREHGRQWLSSLKSGSTTGFGILIQQWVNAVALVWG